MIAINYEVNSNYFTLNNKKFSRVYQPVEMGEDSVAIYNIHDIKNQLLSITNFTEISINGDYYGDRGSLMAALIPVLYSGTTYSGGVGGTPINWQSKIDQKEDAFDKNSAFNKNFGQTAGEVVEGNDVRITRGQTAFSWGNHSNAGYQTEDFSNLMSYANDEDAIAGGVAEGYLYFDEKTKLLRRVGTPTQDLLAYTSITSTNENSDKHPIAQLRDITINETITKLHPLELQGNRLYLRFTHEDGVDQVTNIDLSGLNLTETGITNATYDASTNVITLEENDGDVWQINLSEFSILNNTDVDGVTTLTQEGVVKLTVSRVGQTGDFHHLHNTNHLESKEGAQQKADQAETNAINNIREDGFVGQQKLNFGNAFIKGLDTSDTDINTLIGGTDNGLYFKSTSSGKFVFKLDGNGNDDGFYIVNTPNTITNNKDAQEIIFNLTKDGILNTPTIVSTKASIGGIDINEYPDGAIIESPNWNSISIGLKANAVNDVFKIISRDLADATDRNAPYKNTLFSVDPNAKVIIGKDNKITLNDGFQKDLVIDDGSTNNVGIRIRASNGDRDILYSLSTGGFRIKSYGRYSNILTFESSTNDTKIILNFSTGDIQAGSLSLGISKIISDTFGLKLFSDTNMRFFIDNDNSYHLNYFGWYTNQDDSDPLMYLHESGRLTVKRTIETEGVILIGGTGQNILLDDGTTKPLSELGNNDFVTNGNFSDGKITLNRGELSDITFDIGDYYALNDHNHDSTYLNRNLGVMRGDLIFDKNFDNPEIAFKKDGLTHAKIQSLDNYMLWLKSEGDFGLTIDSNNDYAYGRFLINFNTGSSPTTKNSTFYIQEDGYAYITNGYKIIGGTGDKVLLDNGTTKLLSELVGGGTSDGNDYVTNGNFSDGTVTLNRGNLSDVTFSIGNYYALNNHNHDSEYAAKVHYHDDRYAKLTGANFSGNIYAPKFYETSLRKLKTNIKDFDGNALALVEKLSIVSFDRKDTNANNQIGVIAEDTPKEFLSEKGDAVNLYNTLFIQAKAIQELKNEITELKKMINNG